MITEASNVFVRIPLHSIHWKIVVERPLQILYSNHWKHKDAHLAGFNALFGTLTTKNISGDVIMFSARTAHASFKLNGGTGQFKDCMVCFESRSVDSMQCWTKSAKNMKDNVPEGLSCLFLLWSQSFLVFLLLGTISARRILKLEQSYILWNMALSFTLSYSFILDVRVECSWPTFPFWPKPAQDSGGFIKGLLWRVHQRVHHLYKNK
jgi:hypothetical protein